MSSNQKAHKDNQTTVKQQHPEQKPQTEQAEMVEDLGLVTRGISAAADLPPNANKRLRQASIMRMQRQFGNQYVLRHLAQRPVSLSPNFYESKPRPNLGNNKPPTILLQSQPDIDNDTAQRCPECGQAHCRCHDGRESEQTEPDTATLELSAEPTIQRCIECGQANCGCDAIEPTSQEPATVQQQPEISPLDSQTQARLEQTTDQTLNGVVVHHNDPGLNGRGQLAETQGDHIYLSPNVPGPETELGAQVRLHEATHVMQSRLPDQPLSGQSNGKALVESEAHQVAQAGIRGKKASVQTAANAQQRHGWEWPSLDDISQMGESALAGLVAKISPGLARLVREGPIGMLTTAIKSGVKSFVGSLSKGVDFSSIVSGIKGVFDPVLNQFDGQDDPANCGAFAKAIIKIRNLGRAFQNSAAFKTLQSAFSKVQAFTNKIKMLVLEPAFDIVKTVAGGIWTGIKGIISQIRSWFASAKRVAGRVWNWVKGKLGIDDDGAGFVEWIKKKASEAWDTIKETFAPVAGPLKTVGKILLVTNPMAWPLIAIHYLPDLLGAAEWLYANRDNPDIIRSARQQGHGTLAKLLSGGKSFGQAISSVADTIVESIGKLSSSVLEFLGGISGIPLLSMAQGFVQTVSDGVKGVLDWAKGVFKKGAAKFKSFVNTIQTAIKPYMDILISIGLCTVNPLMIPQVLVGWAWRKLDNCYKPPIIDFLLDIVIGALQALPSMPMLGPLWPILKTGVIGFLKGVKAQDDDVKIKVTNKVAKIMSSPSLGFIKGLVKGVLTGIWEGLTDPFKLIYYALKGLSMLVQWAEGIGGQEVKAMRSDKAGPVNGQLVTKPKAVVQPDDEIVTVYRVDRRRGGTTPANGTAKAPTAAQNNGAGFHGQEMAVVKPKPQSQPAAIAPDQALTAEQIAELTGSFRSFAGEIRPPAEELEQNFMPTMMEAFKKSEGVTLEGMINKLGDAWTAAQAAIQGVAGDLATKVCQFFAGDKAEDEIGEGVGWLIGTIIFEVILGVLTSGTWQAASPIMRTVTKFAKILDWTGEAIGIIFKGLGKLGKLLFKGKGMLGKVLEKAGAAAAKVLEPLEKIATKILNWADEMLAKFGGKLIGKEMAEGAAEMGGKKLAGEAGEELGEAAAGQAGKQLGEEAGQQAGKQAGEEAGQQAGKQAGEEAGQQAGKQAGEEAGQQGVVIGPGPGPKPTPKPPVSKTADDFADAMAKGGADKVQKGRQLLEEVKDIKALRQRVQAGEFGDPAKVGEVLDEARKKIIRDAKKQVSDNIANKYDVKIEYKAPGTPKFTSDVDVTAVAKCNNRIKLEKAAKGPRSAAEVNKLLDDIGMPPGAKRDELAKLLETGQLRQADVGKYLSPNDIKNEIKATMEASQEFYKVLDNPDKALDANFYTELRVDDLTSKFSPADQAKALHGQSAVSMAEMRRNMTPDEWAKYKQAQLDAMSQVDDADGLKRLQEQMDEAERIVADLQGMSLDQAKKDLAKVLDDPNASLSDIREAMAKVKMLEPDAYGTHAAFKDVVDHLQTAARQSDEMKKAIDAAYDAHGIDKSRLNDPKYVEEIGDKLMAIDREIKTKFAKELEDIAGKRGSHGFKPGSPEHLAYLTQEASANMGKLFHAGSPSAQAKYLERIRYAAREAGTDVAGNITDRELRKVISLKGNDEAVNAALREWGQRTGKPKHILDDPEALKAAWTAETKKAAQDTVIDMRTFEQSEYQNKMLQEELAEAG